MMLKLFKKTDPICGMKEEKGKGINKYGKWFCHESCLKKYERDLKHDSKKHGGCCH